MKRNWIGFAFLVAFVTFTSGMLEALQAPQAAGGGRGGPPAAPAGPPAPVPPEVAMQRPAADELARINAALKRFVDTNTSADSALLKKYADMINVPAPRPNAAIAPVQTGPRSNARHDPFVETAKTGDFEITRQMVGCGKTEIPLRRDRVG